MAESVETFLLSRVSEETPLTHTRSTWRNIYIFLKKLFRTSLFQKPSAKEILSFRRVHTIRANCLCVQRACALPCARPRAPAALFSAELHATQPVIFCPVLGSRLCLDLLCHWLKERGVYYVRVEYREPHSHVPQARSLVTTTTKVRR